MFTLTRSRRRSVAIVVDPDASVRVLAPLRTPLSAIEAFVHRKSPWIEKKKAHFLRVFQIYPTQTFKDGMTVWYLGESLTLTLKIARKKGWEFEEDVLYLNVPNNEPTSIKTRIIDMYKTLALDIITDRVEHFLPHIQKSYQSIGIKTLKRQWGHCTRNGHLGFNWLLMLAPLAVIDYVVVHECCHLKVHNHSASFWREVAAILPQYKQEELWLKQNGPGLLHQFHT
jgi:predicted metal-dependent hydrolase